MANRDDHKTDARDMVLYFLDQIVDQLMDSGEASDDINNDYQDGDAYHHETHVDKAYSIREAAELLDELTEFQQDDDGLWEGLSPRDAISAQAAYTYGNAVASAWTNLIRDINQSEEIETLLEAEKPVRATIESAVRAIVAGDVPKIEMESSP